MLEEGVYDSRIWGLRERSNLIPIKMDQSTYFPQITSTIFMQTTCKNKAAWGCVLTLQRDLPGVVSRTKLIETGGKTVQV